MGINNECRGLSSKSLRAFFAVIALSLVAACASKKSESVDTPQAPAPATPAAQTNPDGFWRLQKITDAAWLNNRASLTNEATDVRLQKVIGETEHWQILLKIGQGKAETLQWVLNSLGESIYTGVGAVPESGKPASILDWKLELVSVNTQEMILKEATGALWTWVRLNEPDFVQATQYLTLQDEASPSTQVMTASRAEFKGWWKLSRLHGFMPRSDGLFYVGNIARDKILFAGKRSAVVYEFEQSRYEDESVLIKKVYRLMGQGADSRAQEISTGTVIPWVWASITNQLAALNGQHELYRGITASRAKSWLEDEGKVSE